MPMFGIDKHGWDPGIPDPGIAIPSWNWLRITIIYYM